MRSFLSCKVVAVNGEDVTVRVDQEHVQTQLGELYEAATQPDDALASRYASLYRQAQAMGEHQRWEAAQRGAVRACRGHRPDYRTLERCFGSCVAQEPYTDCSPSSHGGITYSEVCRCGAERPVNVNGMHTEIGCWGMPSIRR